MYAPWFYCRLESHASISWSIFTAFFHLGTFPAAKVIPPLTDCGTYLPSQGMICWGEISTQPSPLLSEHLKVLSWLVAQGSSSLSAPCSCTRPCTCLITKFPRKYREWWFVKILKSKLLHVLHVYLEDVAWFMFFLTNTEDGNMYDAWHGSMCPVTL
jgi:hypothetical protein